MRRVLYIAHRVPFPPDKGERLRAYHQIRALAQRYELTVAALAHSPGDLAAAEALRDLADRVHVVRAGGAAGLARGALSWLAGRSLTEGYFRSRSLARRLGPPRQERPFDLAIGYSSGVLETLLAAHARRRVMDLIDVDSAKWADYACAVRPPRAWLYRLESRRVALLERRALDRCDALLLTSPREAALLGAARLADRVLPVGNGVDLDYFQPAGDAGGDGRSIVFTGTMSYRPNAQAVQWFVRHVWPALRAARADAEFLIVGRDPTPAVRRLAGAPGVTVTGAVGDVRPFLARAAVAVAPLRIARGVQNKVLEAMAMGVAVVGSPAALEGLEVRVGREALCAAGAEQWIVRLRGLLAGREQRVRLGRSARQCVQARYTWAARLAPLLALVESLVEACPASSNRDGTSAGATVSPAVVSAAQ